MGANASDVREAAVLHSSQYDRKWRRCAHEPARSWVRSERINASPPGPHKERIAAIPAAPASMQAAAFDASTPPNAYAGDEDWAARSANPAIPKGRAPLDGTENTGERKIQSAPWARATSSRS